MKIIDHQARYEAHQKRKKEDLAGDFLFSEPQQKEINSWEVIKDLRKSVRVFLPQTPEPAKLDAIKIAMGKAPSSCDRRGVYAHLITHQLQIATLGDCLRGGAGWLKNAPAVFVYKGVVDAYKSPHEVSFMPYLDAGVLMMTACYEAVAQGLGACIINPNIPPEHRAKFATLFNPEGNIFCGAVAVGYEAKRK